MFDFLDENKNYLNDLAQFDFDLLEPELVLRRNNQFNNLDINLDENNKYFSISNLLDTYSLNNSQLDITLENFTSNVNFADVNDLNKDIKWSDQSIFEGTVNNDLIKVDGRKYTNTIAPINVVSAFIGTPGNDSYFGDKSTVDLIDYSNLEEFNLDNLGYKVDVASGLKIYDKNSFLNLHSNNSPLINRELNLDSLIVNKNDILSSINFENIDIIEDIELLRLTPNDDILNIFGNEENSIYDFISGDDTVIYTSEFIPNDLFKFLNLDKFQWRPLDSSGRRVKDKDNNDLYYDFEISYFREDLVQSFLIEDYDPDNYSQKNVDSFHIDYFDPNHNNINSLDWLEVKLVDPLPEIVNQGQPVLKYDFVQDAFDTNLYWLEINAYDFRPNGSGFLGAELELDWNNDDIYLDEILFTNENVFGKDRFPIFQNLGTMSQNDNSSRTTLKGLSGGSLPVASQGIILGYMNSENPDVLFSRLPFRLKSFDIIPDINLSLKSLPASKAKNVSLEKVIKINSNSPKALVIKGTPTQQEIGSHTIKITSNEENNDKSYIFNVESFNDSPIALNFDASSINPLNQSIYQDQSFSQDVSLLFSDEDDQNLTYKLKNPPKWLNIRGNKIFGTPLNEDVGINEVIISASDGINLPVDQKIKINVLNINDAPEVISDIQLPNISQGQRFEYPLTSDSFFDKDSIIDKNENLIFEIHQKDGDSNILKFLSINKNNGNITFTTDHTVVGTSEFTIRATDNEGLFIEQDVQLNVSNINDSPFLTKNIPSFQNPINLSFDEEIDIQIDSWFDDFDLDIDPNENLTFTLLEDDGSGILKRINNGESNWLIFDDVSNILKIKPISEKIGNNFIVVNAKDSQGLEASATIPIIVKYKNNNPSLNYKNPQELLNNFLTNGVSSIIPQTIKNQDGFIDRITFNLKEQSEFLIDLPFDLLKDIDLGTDPDENLTYRIEDLKEVPSSQTYNTLFKFSESNLRISGNTSDLGLKSVDGINKYKTNLLVTDNYGLENSIELFFILERTIEEPQLFALPDEINIDEGNNLNLSQLFEINHEPVTGELFTLFIKNSSLTEEELILRNSSGVIFEQNSNDLNFGEWSISGTLDNVKSFLHDLNVSTLNPHAKGNFQLSILIKSQLGETNLKTQSEFVNKNFFINALPSIPKFSFNNYEINNQDPYSLTKLTSFFNAYSDDPDEEIFYLINFPAERSDLIITDARSSKIGISSEFGILLTTQEFGEATIRSKSGNTESFNLSFSAISKEISNSKQIQTPVQFLNLYGAPLIDEETAIVLITPVGIQNSVLLSELTVLLDIPEGSNTIELHVDLPVGAKIDSVDSIIDIKSSYQKQLSENLNRFTYLINIQDNQVLEQFVIRVQADESFSGKLEGSLDLFTSSREYSDKNQLGFSNKVDIENKIASLNSENKFSWNVIQNAHKPEFIKESELLFNPDTGKLSIGLRRGSSSSGYRNPNESISLSISNIPSGYTLAERIDDNFRPVGATDKFGTISLFIFPSIGEDDNIDLNSFEYVNNNNLYLVSLDENNLNLEDSDKLNLSMSSLITGQEGGDSRSKLVSKSINLSSFTDIENIPNINKNNLIIDPLILSLNDDQVLNLTSVEDSNTIFSMLPGSSPLETGWIKNTNQSLFDNAFLALNDGLDENSNNIQINSITELFSEYFQSNDGLRTFNSGLSALSSIDSDDNLIINSDDLLWEDLVLWFDDGDAKSTENEIYPVKNFLSSINLNTYEIIKNQPEWSSNNQVMGSVNVTSTQIDEKEYKLYDVGLRVNPSSASVLDLKVRSNNDQGEFINIFENGETITFYLDSSESDNWVQEGLDNLTLVRLSGLPDQVTPSLGVKDSRGDWLFTWSDLIKNGGSIKLFPPALWSGFSNMSFLISQLQADGSLVNSPIISYGLNVSPVPTTPLLKIIDQEINEDENIKLNDMISIGKLIDTDGSEKLHYEITSSSENFYFYTLNSSNQETIFEKIDERFIIPYEKINEIFISPIDNFSGSIDFKWKGISTEKSNNLTAEVVRENTLFVNAVADKPLPIKSLNNNNVLVEDKSLALNLLVDVSDFDSGLLDIDGSEEIRYQLEMPNEISLQKTNDENWSPISITNNERSKIITLEGQDLPYLELFDNGFAEELLEIIITRISREVSNASQSKSLGTKLQIPFDKNARPADIEFLDLTLEEDSLGEPISKLFKINPYSQTDNLRYVFENINSNLEILDKENNIKVTSQTEEIIINNLDDYFIKPISNSSGKFSFDFYTISSPKGSGEDALSKKVNCEIEVLAIADLPTLTLKNPPQEKIEINTNGWVSLHELGFIVESDDVDSEEYSVLISAINSDGEVIQFPEQVRLNVPHQESSGTYEVKNKYLNNLSLFLDKVTDDLLISISPKSSENNSESIGSPTQLTIKANLEKIIVKVPLLQVSGTIQGQEDIPFPILTNLGGSILSQHRDKGIGQTLFLELSDLPQGSKILEKLDSDDSVSNFSSPLNLNESGELTQELKLPYSRWETLYLSTPENVNGIVEFNVRSISIANETLEEKSTQKVLVKASLVAVNDAPIIINLNDLDRADEGVLKYWNLKERFFDYDNNISDLKIQVEFKNINNVFTELPSWLSIDDNGILSANANNDHVGIYTLLIKAIDPLGGQVQQEVKIEVGNTNQSPTFVKLPSNWNEITTGDIKEFESTIFLDQTRIIDLSNTFDDLDKKHGDSLNFQISNDGLTWSEEIKNLASLTNGTLFIDPKTKQELGINFIYLKAIDNQGTNSSIKLKINIINVNEPPTVNRSEAIKINQSVWQESFNLIPDKTEFNLNLLDLFTDPDVSDTIEEIRPVLPPWLNLEIVEGKTGGILKGNPKIGDIGISSLDFNAFDQSGKTITYRLILNVQNINDPPTLVKNPDLSSFKKVENGIPHVMQSSYERFNPGILFEDEDFPYGDSLSYELIDVSKIEGDLEKSIENPDWINLSYKTSQVPDNDEKFLIRPIFYKEDKNGAFSEEIGVKELSTLSVNTKLKVKIVASDNRNSTIKGLVGADFDVLVSKSLSIVDNSIKISSDLPLFNNIIRESNGFRIEAGAAPDLGIGDSIGDIEDDLIASFEVLVNNPDLKMMISITPGIGEFRDGFTTRNAESLDQNNSIIHSVSNQEGADIEILAPGNDEVGLYKIKIKAKDQSGESVTAELFINIEDLNEKPTLNLNEISKIQELIKNKRFENSSEISKIFNLFSDPDLINSDNLTLEIEAADKDDIFNEPKFLNTISIQSDKKGNIRFKFDPPRGLKDIVSPRFKITATDKGSLKTESPIFQANFIPKAEVTLLTSGTDKNQLKNENLGNIINKNISFNIANALKINSPELLDSSGDELFINLKIKSKNSAVISDLENIREIISTTNKGEDELIHQINMNKLSFHSGNNFGDLGNLKLEIEPNIFYNFPSNLSNDIKYGIPIEIWTTTRVVDDTNENFDSVESPISKIWLPIRNNPPNFLPPKPIKIDNNFNLHQDSNNILFNLSDSFNDDDKNDLLNWRINLPEKLKGLVILDQSNGNISLNKNVESFRDLPLGNHRILITAEDSSYQFGDKNAKVKGSLRVNIVDNENTQNFINGISLINELNATEVKDIFSRFENNQSLSDQEKDLINIFSRLNIKNQNRNAFIERISSGSATIFNNSDIDAPLVLLDSMSEDELLLLNSEQQELSDQMIIDSQELLGEKDFLDSPLGQLEFTLETNDKQGAFVDIFLEEGGVDIDELIKTNSVNIPNIFKSKTLTFNSNTDGDLDAWLKNLNYEILNYSNENNAISIDFINRSSDISDLNFSNYDVSKIDGSAFLIDTDENGTVDIISMFLLDQGFFDTDSREFIIGDPLIPIDTNKENINNFSNLISNNISSDSVADFNALSNRKPKSFNDLIKTLLPDIKKNSITRLEKLLPLIPRVSKIKEFKSAIISDIEIPNIKPLNSLYAGFTNIITTNKNNFQKLKDSFDSFFEEYNNNGFIGFLTLMFLPIAGERVISPIAKNININYKLDLVRRNPYFSGQWGFVSSIGKKYKIIKSFNKLELIDIEDIFEDEYIQPVNGFDLKNKSLLYKVFLKSKQPGLFLEALKKVQSNYQDINSFDINWKTWINDNLLMYVDQKNKYNKIICSRLVRLIEDTSATDISVTDMTMLAHIVDCCESVHLPINKAFYS